MPITSKKHALLSRQPYQVFRHSPEGTILVRRTRTEGLYQAWRLTREAPAVGGVRSSADDVYTLITPAQAAQVLERLAGFYGVAYQDAIARLGKKN